MRPAGARCHWGALTPAASLLVSPVRASLSVPRRLGTCALIAWQLSCTADRGAGGGDAPEGTRAATASRGYPVQVTDDSGAQYRFDAPPERIVSLVPSATETLLALGLRESLVGRTDYDHLAELAELPSVGGGLQPNLEVLVSLDPDLVVRFEGESDQATADRLSDLAIPHFAIRPDGIADVQSIIGRLGAITGAVAAADSILAEIQEALDDVAARVDGLPRRKVVYLMGGDPPLVSGPGTYIDELMVAGGAENVFDDLDGLYVPVSLEELINREVDLILLSAGSVPEQLSHVEHVSLPSSVEVPGPGLGEAARTIARLIHPEAFR